MGLGSYFAPGKAKKGDSKKDAKKDAKKASSAATEITNEKPTDTSSSGGLSPLPKYPSAIGTPGQGASPWASRPGSTFGGNDNRDELKDLKCDMMVNWLYQQQMELLWTAGGYDEGIVLKKSRGQYTCCPSDIDQDPAGFFKAVQALNVRCAMTVNTRVIKLFLHGNDRPYVPLKDGLRLQVLPDISYLPRCQKHQFAAFIADRGILVVWDDEPRHLLKRSQNIQEALMAMIWPEEGEEEVEEKNMKDTDIGVNEVGSDYDDAEAGANEKPRRIVLNQSIITALTLCLVTMAMGSAFAKIAKEVYLDGNYIRLAFVLALPAQIWLSLFFFQSVIGTFAQILGPIAQLNQNTKYYSGLPPRRLKIDDGPLPHVTIQCPVYKEGLQSVIEPTIRSIKAAISTYEMQGGTANIFINDDGMQLISEEEARARQDFYDEHNIGWVARPRHDPNGEHGEAFTRRGKFKKASNMNYSLWASNRVEEKLAAIHRPQTWTQEDEAEAYRNALVEVVEEDQGRTWADGNIRIGDYILIIDSDTRVPTDCLLNAVSEMDASPQVGIIQFNSGVMNITDSFFEKGITFFTNLVYTQIKFAVANGDVAPFVGHNAVLRWAAVQSIGFEEDDREKFWSESTVSEDFDMSLRLQAEGFIVRYGAYFGDGFKEGVSLTVYDELARWEKYAYGCNELLFNPLSQWFKKGPLTGLFRRFLGSGMPVASKITIMAYIGTYYALGSSWILTVMNYFIVGWYNGWLDHYYLDSFKIYLAIVVVFSGAGNVALAVLRYRTEEQGLMRAMWTNIKYIPIMMLFLGGVSMHVSQALVSHMVGIDMNWGATSKEADNTTFFEEVPKVIKAFKWTFVICTLLIITMIVCSVALPALWQINLFIAIYPLCTIVFCHFLSPIVLNPNLMLFTF